jgi:hypothetical protein
MIRTGLSPNTVDTSQIHVSNARCTEVMQRVLSSIRSLPQGDMLLELQSVLAPRPDTAEEVKGRRTQVNHHRKTMVFRQVLIT